MVKSGACPLLEIILIYGQTEVDLSFIILFRDAFFCVTVVLIVGGRPFLLHESNQPPFLPQYFQVFAYIKIHLVMCLPANYLIKSAVHTDADIGCDEFTI